jgi:hypothetical protein
MLRSLISTLGQSLTSLSLNFETLGRLDTFTENDYFDSQSIFLGKRL